MIITQLCCLKIQIEIYDKAMFKTLPFHFQCKRVESLCLNSVLIKHNILSKHFTPIDPIDWRIRLLPFSLKIMLFITNFIVLIFSAARWNHVEDLDSFFMRIYLYHQKHGFACMMLQQVLELVQFIFVLGFTTFLSNCVDYQIIFRWVLEAQCVGLI